MYASANADDLNRHSFSHGQTFAQQVAAHKSANPHTSPGLPRNSSLYNPSDYHFSTSYVTFSLCDRFQQGYSVTPLFGTHLQTGQVRAASTDKSNSRGSTRAMNVPHLCSFLQENLRSCLPYTFRTIRYIRCTFLRVTSGRTCLPYHWSMENNYYRRTFYIWFTCIATRRYPYAA